MSENTAHESPESAEPAVEPAPALSPTEAAAKEAEAERLAAAAVAEEEAAEQRRLEAEAPPVETARDLTRSVDVGGKTYEIGRFKGYKATRIMREAAAIGRRFPEITKLGQDYEQAYLAGGALRLSRTEAELKFGDDAREISEAAWSASDNELPLRRMPDPSERLLAVAPAILDAAEDRVVTLLALISASNAELKEADQAEAGVDGFLERRGRELMHEGDLEELVNLAVAGFEVGRAQFAPLEGMVGKAIGLLNRRRRDPDPIEENPTSDPSPTSPPSSETSPSSSSDSGPPSDTPATTSSSGSPGSSSELSAGG